MSHETWLTEPEEHDYPAAAEYLALVLEPTLVDSLIMELRSVPITQFKAKDLLRASRLPALDDSNRHVSKDLKRMHNGTPLSPVLAVRGDAASDRPLIIADGFHRICAAYHDDEDVEVPCKLVSLPGR